MILLQLLMLKWFLLSSYNTQDISIRSSSFQVKLGDDLTISCKVSKPIPTLSVFLECPNDRKFNMCYRNCYNACDDDEAKCSKFTMSMVIYGCKKFSSIGEKEYRYTIRVNRQLIENRKILPYKCSYMDKKDAINITVIESKFIETTSTTRKKVATTLSTKVQYTTTESIDWVMGGLTERKKWLLGLLAVLGISILINFMCCCICIVNGCTERSLRKQYKVSQPPQPIVYQHSPVSHINTARIDDNFSLQGSIVPVFSHLDNSIEPQNNSSAALNYNKRARSQPTLNKTDSNTTPLLIQPYEINPNTPSIPYILPTTPRDFHQATYKNSLYNPHSGLHTPVYFDNAPRQMYTLNRDFLSLNNDQSNVHRNNINHQQEFQPIIPDNLNVQGDSSINGDENSILKNNGSII